MKKLLLMILIFSILLPNVVAQEESSGSSLPVRFGISAFYRGYLGSTIESDDDRPDRDMNNHLGGIEFTYYHSRSWFTTAAIAFGYRYEYGAEDGRVHPAGLAGVATMDLSATFNYRIPVGLFTGFSFGVGWYVTTALSTLSGESISFMGDDNFGYNTGFIFRVGVVIGLDQRGQLFFPASFSLRVDVQNGVAFSGQTGIGVRF